MKTFFTFLIVCFTAFSSYAQSGILDKSFGDTGVVITPVAGNMTAMALQSDGKIIVSGNGLDDTPWPLLLRYQSNGQLDKSFGNAGILYIKNNDVIQAVAILPDDKILAVYYEPANYEKMQLTEYVSDGSLDSAFGSNGQIHQSFSGVDGIYPKAVKLQMDGKIVVTGAAYFFDPESGYYNPKIITVRFNTDGSLDESFGGKGYVLLEGKIANALIIQQDGKIVIGGNTGLQESFITARYLTDGNLDNSYGTNGVVTTGFDDHRCYINDLALQQDGKILATGTKDNGFGGMLTACYLADGSLDKSFGTNGLATVQFAEGSSEAINIFLEDNSKIILTGRTGNIVSYDAMYFAVVKLNTDGSIDSSFATNGRVATSITGIDFATCGALQANGKILLGGINNDVTNFIIARYNNDGKSAPVARIKKWIRNHWVYWQNQHPQNDIAYYTIAQSNNAINGFREIARVPASAKNMYSYALPATANNTQPTANYYCINAVNNSDNIISSEVISDAETENVTLLVYPNPVKDVLHIKGLDAVNSYQLIINNERGNIVAKTSINKSASYNLNLQNLSKGVYYGIIISSNKKTNTTKFIKE